MSKVIFRFIELNRAQSSSTSVPKLIIRRIMASANEEVIGFQ